MNAVEKQTLVITVEGDEVITLKAAIRALAQSETRIGFPRQRELNEKEAKLFADIDRQVNK